MLVEEPSIDDSISILRGLKQKYEAYHGVKILDSAIISAVENALEPFQIHLTRAPLMPSDIIQAIAKANNQDAA